MLCGSIVALATPFTAHHHLDERAFVDLVAWQIEEGSDALAVCTATGEAPTLTSGERRRIVEIAAETAGGCAPVLAAIVANCTRQAVEEARSAKGAGADALIVAVPAYNKPTQDGIVRHVEAIARAAGLPILVQNDPARCVTELKPETAARLARLEAVSGFVDTSGELTRILLASLGSGKPLDLFTASDAVSAPFALAGGSGTLSVVANVAPRLCAELQRACRTGELARATAIQRRLHPLASALALETDPIAVKYALFLLREHFSPALRLPLVAASCATARMVAAALEGLRGEVAYA